MINALKMEPVFKSYIWGGDNIKKIYHKNTPLPPVAESWEVASHNDGMSVVAEGEYKGLTISQLTEKLGGDFLGTTISTEEKFPLLLKILDAQDRLSVQVHPNDEYANINENGEKGKTECWYVLDAKDGATLVYGFKEGVTTQSYEKAIEDGKLEEILNFVQCEKGDVFFIPAGTVHAVGEGLIIAEIQQNSNTTYRVYDYNRTDKEGKTRELHIKKAMDVSNISSICGSEKTTGKIVNEGDNNREYVICDKYFAFEKINIEAKSIEDTEGKLEILFFEDGFGDIDGVKFAKGDSFIIPANMGVYNINGKSTVLKFYVPEKSDFIKWEE